MSFPGGMEMLLVLSVVMLLFGAKKLPELARSMGRAGREFKTGLKDGESASIDGPCPFCEVAIPEDAKFCPGCAKRSSEIISARIRAVPQAS